MISQDFANGLQIFALAFVPAMFGIICHEVAHGWVAYKLGDPTAKFLGRLTLNPVKHIDPVGLGVFAFTALFSPFIIGWAKPVPVEPRYFKNPRQGMTLVSVAGPLTNFLVATLCALLLKLMLNLITAGMSPSTLILVLVHSAFYGVTINCALAWFNLMPIPPLDGSHILAGLLPPSLARSYMSLGRFGLIIVLLLVMAGLFRLVLMPLILYSIGFFFTLFGISGQLVFKLQQLPLW